MEGTPAVFLDGVYVHDPNQIAEIHPEQIDRIEVVRETYQVGDVVMDGIISMYTKDGDFNLIEPPITAVRRRYPLFSRPESFISPDHSEAGSKDSRIPDMRNTLFWAPQVAFDSAGLASVHFFTGDVKSDFEILVQGVTRWGEVVCSRKIFTVE
jgi:hypothetical protein